MNDNNNEQEPLQQGDLKAARNKHHELHSLLTFICQDEFAAFQNLSGEHQQGVLQLLRSTSDALGDCLEPFQ